ncbi:ABC transporter ATP-binding protein [Limosilactobacillus vaginalis]|uniref:ABC transporter ATP-binding protein n=1 Tax=Limosilactobacillus vaginalis TaxID=1633 RepID=UPI0023595D02|nr:ATP-binding cassette domain-containing protein [Limosilactobacillus vaginalis]WCT59668.1 ATP-binding cassette domain-containing protein [Limosilactobacillus vaginalis]
MLTVKNLNIFYGRKQIIENASFSIKPSEIVGLIGPNGAGKTTIMKSLLGLTKFTGSIAFNNQPITANNHKALQNVGALIENPAIYPFLSGKDNLSLYSTDKGEVAELITKLQMNSYIQRQAKSYSIGMKQKLGIALALLNHPQFVILDEPMNGLDIETTILIRKIIHEYAHKGTAFLISSHVLSELQKVMTSVIILNQGHIIMDVPVSQFQERDSQQYRLVTTDNQTAIKLLTANSITVTPTSTGLIVNKDALSQIQQILFKNQVWLRELVPNVPSFEKKIITVLKERWENSNGK